MREEESEKSRKRQTQSCDRCKVKKRRCDGNTPCEKVRFLHTNQYCIKADSECTMNIEQKKRGPKRSSDVNVDNSDSTPKKSRILINSSQNMPILDEKLFMENLIPVNNHPPMLLNIIYAIGCHYSRSPQLYQVPFYNPQKASEYFINQALISTPAPETWASISSDSISVSQASLLLSAYDCITHKTHTWMMIDCSTEERKRFAYSKFLMYNRAWWGTMMCDLFLTLSTGTPLMINELDYIETITSPSGQMSPTTCPLAEADISVIQTQIRSKKQNSANDSDKWMPFFSGFPKDTIFGASDVNSECWGRQSTGFFQVNHLFSKSDDITHLMQLSFITRRAIRYVTAPKVPTCQTQSVSLLTNLIPTSTSEIVRLHDSLILWFESLPIELRFWKSLEGLTSNSALEMDNYCSLNADQRLSSTAVLINLLFTATISLLHQKNAESSSINFSPNNANASNSNHMFRISSSMLSRGVFDSSAMLRLSYKGTCYLLKRVYGQYMPPSPTIIPPSEIVGTPVISALIMPVVIGLLSQQIYAGKLMETGSRLSLSAHPETVGVDPLESVIFPVLDNISQVWPVAKTHANSLRQLTQQLQSKLNSSQNSNQIASLWQKSSFHADTTSPSQPTVTTTPTFNIFSRTNEVNQTAQLQFTNNGINGTQGTVNVANVAPTPAASITSADQNEVVNSGAKTDMNWHDLRNAFEDEFLL
ncbi:hypothetical protein HDV02_001019 [Globomyces sp. JEL0801]|nr:hypothetical protein HDV02_001019 [Globomyces sp. JEL0801]